MTTSLPLPRLILASSSSYRKELLSRLRLPLYALFAATVLGGCTTLPSGPSVAVMPAPNKPFEVFEHDDLVCREYASRRIGVDPATQQQGQIATGAIAGGTAYSSAAVRLPTRKETQSFESASMAVNVHTSLPSG